MSTYTKPELESYKSDLLMELTGPIVTAYQGTLDIGAARRPLLTSNAHRNQIVICKTVTLKSDEVVKLG